MMFDHFDPPARPQVDRLATLLDVTLRDGGFEVDFRWPAGIPAAVTGSLAPLGVDIVELGYLGGVPIDHGVADAGPSAHLTPDDVSAARRDGLRLAAMVHPTALGTAVDVKSSAAAGLDMLRLVYHPDWFDQIRTLAGSARDLGLAVSVNIALASRYLPHELCQHVVRIHTDMQPTVIYVADTCGALTPHQVTTIVTMLRNITDTSIGFHAHDFLSLGYANALAAAAAGATYLDSSVLGLGRGGGNLATDLMLIRHRLPGSHHTNALLRYLNLRHALAQATGRPATPLLATVCGALNLTPVEEQAVIDFADNGRLDHDAAGLWLIGAAERIASWHAEDLWTTWQDEQSS
jgi:isopropylmalate/homocitrate/citramalate synthase